MEKIMNVVEQSNKHKIKKINRLRNIMLSVTNFSRTVTRLRARWSEFISGQWCFSSPPRPDRLGVHPVSYQMATGGYSSGGKEDVVRSWPLISIYCRG